jgi:hypothetical protein
VPESEVYLALNKVSNEMKEEKDCAVKAIAAVGNLEYDEAHCLMEMCGRESKSVTPSYVIERALKFLEVKLEDCTDLFRSMGGKTIRTLGRLMEGRKGETYLVRTASHIFAVKDGEVCDWTIGRLHRIQSVERAVYGTAANSEGS